MNDSMTPWLQRQGHATLAIFRALQLGDMLCAVPALRALRSALPGTRITLVGLPWTAQFARRFSHYIDDFIAFPGHEALPEQAVQQHMLADFYAGMRARRFDMAIQLHGSGVQSNLITRAFGARAMAGYGDERPGPGEFLIPAPHDEPESSRLLALASSLGAPSAGEQLEFPITEADERELWASGLVNDLQPGSYVCIHPGARLLDKCWPAVRFAQVADQVARQSGLRIVLTGSANEALLTSAVAGFMRSPALDTASPMSIGAMAALMKRSRLLIANDTGVSHIAAGLGLPSVIIFSKANMRRWSPLNKERHRCLWDPGGDRATDVVAHARALLALDA